MGDTEDRGVPTQVGNDSNWSEVWGGYAHTCAIKTDGSLWCWGGSWSGQTGPLLEYGSEWHVEPIQVGGADDWKDLGLGDDDTCAVNKSGQLLCFGNLLGGEFGKGTGAPYRSPVPMLD